MPRRNDFKKREERRDRAERRRAIREDRSDGDQLLQLIEGGYGNSKEAERLRGRVHSGKK